LGDDRFSERALTKAAEKYRSKLLLEEVIEAVCDFYDINANLLADPGKAARLLKQGQLQPCSSKKVITLN